MIPLDAIINKELTLTHSSPDELYEEAMTTLIALDDNDNRELRMSACLSALLAVRAAETIGKEKNITELKDTANKMVAELGEENIVKWWFAQNE